MVWSQYVYEATTGFDHDGSGEDDELNERDAPLNIENWEVEYSDELSTMWNTMRTLFYDARIEHSGRFCDFVEFCFTEHDEIPPVSWEYQEQHMWYEERLAHVWRSVRRVVNDNGLHEHMMRGASFNNFLDFCKNIMSVY